MSCVARWEPSKSNDYICDSRQMEQCISHSSFIYPLQSFKIGLLRKRLKSDVAKVHRIKKFHLISFGIVADNKGQ